MNDYVKDYGKCCNACKYYNIGNGYCRKKNEYHKFDDYDVDDSRKCDKWKIADDLVNHREKSSKKKSDQLKLF